MRFELIVPIEFDVLDAAINVCLPGYVPAGWVEFERIVITPSSTKYALCLEKHGDLGDLGSIHIRKANKTESIINVHDPERPKSKKPSQQEWEQYNFSQYPKEERIKKKLDVLNGYRDEAKELHKKRKDHQKKVISALFSRLANDSATESVFSHKELPTESKLGSIEHTRLQISDFQDLVERQLHNDFFDDGKPQEKIARLALQTFLSGRSYREVPVRGGQSDILIFNSEGRLLFETKIWRGAQSFEAGIKELSEYAIGENTDDKLVGAFYIVFDPTKTNKATSHLGSRYSIIESSGYPIDVFVINLFLETPSKIGFT